MGFRSGWLAFKAGFDKGHIWEYWKAIREHAWEIWWGAGPVGIICTVITLYYAPSRWILGWVIAWAFLVAGYYIWRADHIRLIQKLEISHLRINAWVVAHGLANAGHLARAYYFGVVNRSEGSTIEGVNVQVSRICPEVENLGWLPIHLHLQHDNPNNPEDQITSFNLNPGAVRNVDFVSALTGNTVFSIDHVVSTANHVVPYGSEGHRLEVMVTAGAMPPLYVWFRVWREESGELMCEMEQ